MPGDIPRSGRMCQVVIPHCKGCCCPPESIALARGRLEVSFSSIEQLAEALYALARVFDNDQDAFIQAYEPERPPAILEEAGEIDALFAELEAMERERATARS